MHKFVQQKTLFTHLKETIPDDIVRVVDKRLEK
jgi:hypothetical protein